MYSASAVDNATDVCFLLLQLIGAPLSLNKYLDVDFRSFTSPAQSESEYPCNSSLSSASCTFEIPQYSLECSPV